MDPSSKVSACLVVMAKCHLVLVKIDLFLFPLFF